MSADLCRVKYDFILGSLTHGQMDFIEDIIYRSDDGTYELSNEEFREMKQRKSEFEKLYKINLEPIFQAFAKEIKRGKGDFSFRMFA